MLEIFCFLFSVLSLIIYIYQLKSIRKYEAEILKLEDEIDDLENQLTQKIFESGFSHH